MTSHMTCQPLEPTALRSGPYLAHMRGHKEETTGSARLSLALRFRHPDTPSDFLEGEDHPVAAKP